MDWNPYNNFLARYGRENTRVRRAVCAGAVLHAACSNTVRGGGEQEGRCGPGQGVDAGSWGVGGRAGVGQHAWEPLKQFSDIRGRRQYEAGGEHATWGCGGGGRCGWGPWA